MEFAGLSLENQVSGVIGGPLFVIQRNASNHIVDYFQPDPSGDNVIASGATSVVVTHGLWATPTPNRISIMLKENPTNDPGNIWVDTCTATQFTVHCRNDPGASHLDFGWRYSE